ncbi:hypothetical protein Aperf_G00000085987 [Anoplocephala perfoliata]
MSSITLGFVEPDEPFRLISHFFPDKVGGRPAWLALNQMPNNLQCPNCQKTMVFLLQLYSPIERREDCFHRMLFVFMCKNGNCFQSSAGNNMCPFRVFRSQLPRKNPFYSADPPTDSEDLSQEAVLDILRSGNTASTGLVVNLCPVCGCPGTKCCFNCKKAYYCCKEHQVIHWKQRHKASCPNYDYLEEMFLSNSFLLPEFLLTSEIFDNDTTVLSDDTDDDSDFEPDQSDEAEEFKKLGEISRKETRAERYFNRFKEILKREPDQVVRFDRGGVPLWATSTCIEPPNCSKCGGKRIFEFQITPQILLHLNLDKVGEASPDFASVYIFTCENSCPLAVSSGESGGSSVQNYVEEFVTFDLAP